MALLWRNYNTWTTWYTILVYLHHWWKGLHKYSLKTFDCMHGNLASTRHWKWVNRLHLPYNHLLDKQPTFTQASSPPPRPTCSVFLAWLFTVDVSKSIYTRFSPLWSAQPYGGLQTFVSSAVIGSSLARNGSWTNTMAWYYWKGDGSKNTRCYLDAHLG